MAYTTGSFKAKALSGDLGYAKSGTEQVAVQFEILEGPDTGRAITWWGYFSDKAVDRTLKALMVAGWDGNDVAVLGGLGANEVSIKIEDDVYNGETRQRVQWVNPLRNGPSAGGAMNDTDKASFAERMKGRALHLKSEQPSSASAPVADDDDIPF
jgi:hypothetical protein